MSIVPIVISINNSYVIPAITTMRSVLDSVSYRDRIKFVIFHKELEQQAMDLMTAMVSRSGGEVSFLNMKHAFSGVLDDDVKQIEMYYSLLIPQYMKNYEFVFSLDADMLVSGDILSLIPQMPANKKIGAVRCAFRNTLLPPDVRSPLQDETIKVGIQDTRNYFNAGLMLFNMKEIDYEDSVNCIRFILRDWPGHGESILNHVFHDSTYFFSFRWNFPMTFIPDKVMNFHPDIQHDIVAGRRDPKVQHFLFISKPWHENHQGLLDINKGSPGSRLTDYLEEYRKAIFAVMKEAAQLMPRLICGPTWDDMEKLVTSREQAPH